ncbi:MAG: hypothetical protein HON42_04780 [Alphaproteobacteria bacterium]|jgi:peptidyl-prolyl cis-trans isomerase C|nr:hypothetical protein [Alphaproteobacteria bacterium]MBT5827975.1 hypothetical protein [Alphaproteobacteria bacterium]
MDYSKFKDLINLKQKNIIFIGVIAVILIASVIFVLNSNTGSKDSVQIVSKFNGGEVSLEEAQLELNKLALNNQDLQGVDFLALNIDEQELIIKEIIIKKIAYREALKRKLNKSDSFESALQNFKTEILAQNLYNDIKEKALNADKLQAEYVKLTQELKDKKEIKISFIAVETEQKAQNIRKIISRYPNSFAKQAKKHSIDKNSAKNGGDMGYVYKSSLSAEILAAAEKVKRGSITKPILVGEKWLIVKLEDERDATIPEYDSIKTVIEQSVAQKAVQEFILTNMENANISISIN